MKSTKDSLLEDIKAEFAEVNAMMEALEAKEPEDEMEALEIGFCKGIENYSRVLSRREPGSTPYTLLDHFGDDF